MDSITDIFTYVKFLECNHDICDKVENVLVQRRMLKYSEVDYHIFK